MTVLHCFYFKLIGVFQNLGFFFTPLSKLFFQVAFAPVCRLFCVAPFTKIMQLLSTRFQYFTCQSKTVVLQTSYHLKFRLSLKPCIFFAIFVPNYAVQKIFQCRHAIHKFFRLCWKGNIHVCLFQSRGVCNSNQALSRQCPTVHTKPIASFLIYVEICRMDTRHLSISAKSDKIEF